MLQKRYKGTSSTGSTSSSKAKMKKTPTLAELKVSRQKKRMQVADDIGMASSRHSGIQPHRYGHTQTVHRLLLV